jgi:probable F420-dependent oxidoreductase
MSRPFRFGLQCFNVDSGKQWKDLARKCEDLGYSALHMSDHFLGPGPKLDETNHPPTVLSATPAMATALALTSTLRVGCRVFCQDYHHPVVLAKEIATMDLMSEGRVEVGIGAGWIKAEYEAAGIQFDSPGTRIRRLGEYVSILKTLLRGDEIDHHGEFFEIFGFKGLPDVVQKPHPPIMIGGGAPKILGLAGREADVVSFNYNNRAGVIGPEGFASATAEETDKKIQWVKDGAGGRFDDIELETGLYMISVTDHQQATAEEFAKFLGCPVDALLAHPNALIGSVDYCCDTLMERRDRFGISYITPLEIEGNNISQGFAPVVARLAGK